MRGHTPALTINVFLKHILIKFSTVCRLMFIWLAHLSIQK